MKDKSLAERKIIEKARLRGEFVRHYRSLTSGIQDIRHFSKTSEIERTAALIADDKANKINEEKDIYRVRKAEEIEEDIKQIEDYMNRPKALFNSALERFQSCLDRLISGEKLPDEDQTFYDDYFESLNEGDRKYWELYKDSVKPATEEKSHEMVFCP